MEAMRINAEERLSLALESKDKELRHLQEQLAKYLLSLTTRDP